MDGLFNFMYSDRFITTTKNISYLYNKQEVKLNTSLTFSKIFILTQSKSNKMTNFPLTYKYNINLIVVNKNLCIKKHYCHKNYTQPKAFRYFRRIFTFVWNF